MCIVIISVIAWAFWRLTATQQEINDQLHDPQQSGNKTIDTTHTEISTAQKEPVPTTKIIPTMTAQELHIATISPNADIIMIDTRSKEQYSAAHIPGSYHIDTIDRSRLARTIILINDNGNEDLLISLFRELSTSHEIYNLENGLTEWKTRGYKTLSHTFSPDFVTSSKVQFVEPRDLDAFMRDPLVADDLLIIDTRRPGNFATGHVPKAMNIPLTELEFRYREIPRQKKIFIYGANQESSFQSGALLHDLDFLNVKTINGGFAAWEQYKYPVSTE